MNHRIYIVDRIDQVKWFLDETTSVSFHLQMQENHRVIREWLEANTTDVVVISAQGVMPRVGTTDHAYHSLLHYVQRDQYKLYFNSEDDAVLFKLTWGGTI